jgi:hypothetical protein
MAQNAVQYQRGLSLPEFFDQHGSQEQCEDLVRAWRWPGGFVCPRCQGAGTASSAASSACTSSAAAAATSAVWSPAPSSSPARCR